MIKILLAASFLAPSPVLQAQNQGNLDYVVTYHGKTVSNHGNVLDDQIWFAVARFSNKELRTDSVMITVNAVSDFSKEAVNRSPVILPEVIYSSIRHVAKSIFAIKKSKTKKDFDIALKKYRIALSDANDIVAVLGYELVGGVYRFNNGEIKISG